MLAKVLSSIPSGVAAKCSRKRVLSLVYTWQAQVVDRASQWPLKSRSQSRWVLSADFELSQQRLWLAGQWAPRDGCKALLVLTRTTGAYTLSTRGCRNWGCLARSSISSDVAEIRYRVCYYAGLAWDVTRAVAPANLTSDRKGLLRSGQSHLGVKRGMSSA
jgi:sarcosine oxidase delta subunit